MNILSGNGWERLLSLQKNAKEQPDKQLYKGN